MHKGQLSEQRWSPFFFSLVAAVLPFVLLSCFLLQEFEIRLPSQGARIRSGLALIEERINQTKMPVSIQNKSLAGDELQKLFETSKLFRLQSESEPSSLVIKNQPVAQTVEMLTEIERNSKVDFSAQRTYFTVTLLFTQPQKVPYEVFASVTGQIETRIHEVFKRILGAEVWRVLQQRIRILFELGGISEFDSNLRWKIQELEEALLNMDAFNDVIPPYGAQILSELERSSHAENCLFESGECAEYGIYAMLKNSEQLHHHQASLFQQQEASTPTVYLEERGGTVLTLYSKDLEWKIVEIIASKIGLPGMTQVLQLFNKGSVPGNGHVPGNGQELDPPKDPLQGETSLGRLLMRRIELDELYKLRGLTEYALQVQLNSSVYSESSSETAAIAEVLSKLSELSPQSSNSAFELIKKAHETISYSSNKLGRIDTFPTDYKLGAMTPLLFIAFYPVALLIVNTVKRTVKCSKQALSHLQQ